MADYAIIRVQKFHKTDLPGIQKHMGRQAESHSNPDIDQEKSISNFAMLRQDNNIAAEVGNLTEKVKKRISQVPHQKAVRKDAVVLCDVLVTFSPDKMQDPNFDYRQYFSQALHFLQKRYGKDNIVYAVVHNDEKTPHMDVGLVPIVGDRLCAKELFARRNLIKLHTDFARYVGQDFGLERGKQRLDGEAYVKHLSDLEYKTKTKEAELTDKIEQKRQKLAKITAKMPKKRSTLLGLRSEYDERAVQILALQAAAGRADLRTLKKVDERSQALDKREADLKAREDAFKLEYGRTPEQLLDEVKSAREEVKDLIKDKVRYLTMLRKAGLIKDDKGKSRDASRTKAKNRDGLER